MDTTTNVLRNVRRESGERRDHLETFREFIDHLNRASRSRGTKSAKKQSTRAGKR